MPSYFGIFDKSNSSADSKAAFALSLGISCSPAGSSVWFKSSVTTLSLTVSVSSSATISTETALV